MGRRSHADRTRRSGELPGQTPRPVGRPGDGGTRPQGVRRRLGHRSLQIRPDDGPHLRRVLARRADHADGDVEPRAPRLGKAHGDDRPARTARTARAPLQLSAEEGVQGDATRRRRPGRRDRSGHHRRRLGRSDLRAEATRGCVPGAPGGPGVGRAHKTPERKRGTRLGDRMGVPREGGGTPPSLETT
jgi:hypothetical protein